MNLISTFIKTLLFLNAVVDSWSTQEVSSSKIYNLGQHRSLVTRINDVIESNRDTILNNDASKNNLDRYKDITVHTDKEISVKQNDSFNKQHKIDGKHYTTKSISYKERRSLKNDGNKDQTKEEENGTFRSHETELSNQDGDIKLRLQARDYGRSNDLVVKSKPHNIKYAKYDANKISKRLDPFYEPESVPKPKLASRSLISEIERYAKYAGASYCIIHTTKNIKCNYCKEFSKGSVTFPIVNTAEINGKSIKIHAIIVLDTIKKEVALAYRGSNDIPNLLGSKLYDMMDYPDIPEAKVNAFFYKGVKSIHKEITKRLTTTMRIFPEFRLAITGHSLGGALATLSAPLIHRDVGIPYTQMRLITYGQLRVGNLAYALWYNNLKIDFSRVVNENDGTANLPKFSSHWVHVQTEIHIKNGRYYDCKTSKIEHPHCSFRKTSLVGIKTNHGKVGKINVSPDYCTRK